MTARQHRPGTADGTRSPSGGLGTDAGLALIVLVTATTAIAADIGARDRPAVAAYLCAAGLAALMFARRRFPVQTLLATALGIVAYHAAGLPPIGLALPVAAALYSAAEAGRLAWAAGTSAGLLVVSTSVRLAVGDDARILLGYELGVNVAVMAAAIALGDGVRARRRWRSEQRRRARDAELEREREAARRVQEERLRIARQLHDELAHALAVVSLHADVASEALADDPEAAESALERIRGAARDSLRQLRSTVGVLRAGQGVAGGAEEGLDRLDQVIGPIVAGGLPVSVRVHGAPRPLPERVDGAAYRIAQEALTNALRHAQARRAEVHVTYLRDRLELRVVDDGRGSGGRPGAGHGVAGMRERAALLGGSVRAGDRPTGGYQVEASLPLTPPVPA